MLYKIELEFKRIQTYLFASPRLRAMLGANASLGATVRVELVRLARDCGAKADESILDKLPCAAAGDPLGDATLGDALSKLERDFVLADDPQKLYREYGVLVRDGGHFVATFPSRNSAQCFIENAIRSITERLPGILVEARIDGEVPKLHATGNTGEAIFLHPSFQVSHYLGNRPAQNRNPKGAFVSAEEEQLEEAGKNFRNTPGDIIGMLEKAALIPRSATLLQTLEDVTQGDYLALIHADGNEIGKRYQRWRERSTKETPLDFEARGEHFFHTK